MKREKIAGALTAEEVAEIKRWIKSLRAPTQGVFDFSRAGSVPGHSSQTRKEGRKPSRSRNQADLLSTKDARRKTLQDEDEDQAEALDALRGF